MFLFLTLLQVSWLTLGKHPQICCWLGAAGAEPVFAAEWPGWQKCLPDFSFPGLSHCDQSPKPSLPGKGSTLIKSGFPGRRSFLDFAVFRLKVRNRLLRPVLVQQPCVWSACPIHGAPRFSVFLGPRGFRHRFIPPVEAENNLWFRANKTPFPPSPLCPEIRTLIREEGDKAQSSAPGSHGVMFTPEAHLGRNVERIPPGQLRKDWHADTTQRNSAANFCSNSLNPYESQTKLDRSLHFIFSPNSSGWEPLSRPGFR